MDTNYTHFSPWNETDGLKAAASISHLVKESPCTHCKFWNPVVDDEPEHEDRGITICHSKDQHHDFSCYRWDEKTVPNSSGKNERAALKQALESESSELIKVRKEHTKERDHVYEANKRVSDQLHAAQDEIKFLKSVIKMFDKLTDKIGEY